MGEDIPRLINSVEIINNLQKCVFLVDHTLERLAHYSRWKIGWRGDSCNGSQPHRGLWDFIENMLEASQQQVQPKAA